MQSRPQRVRPSAIRYAVAALVLVMLSLFITTPAAAGIHLTWRFTGYIEGANSIQQGTTPMCVADPNKSDAQGAKMIQWDCHFFDETATEQQWQFFEDTDLSTADETVYQIKNLHSGQCLADPGASPNRGVQLIQWPCGNNGNEQRWIAGDDEPYITLENYSSHLYMAVSGGRLVHGVPIIQWTETGGFEQAWDGTHIVACPTTTLSAPAACPALPITLRTVPKSQASGSRVVPPAAAPPAR